MFGLNLPGSGTRRPDAQTRSVDRHRQRRPILPIREPLSSAFIRDTEPKQWQTNPRDLDAEMMTRLPVATAEDHHNLFMAIDGVVGGMHGADALLLAGQ